MSALSLTPETPKPSNDNRHIAFTREFNQRGEFAAYEAAAAFATAAGFCVGSTCRDKPTGLMFGYDYVAKYRNLTSAERAALHSVLTGERRHGPILMIVFATAPLEARVALSAETGASA